MQYLQDTEYKNDPQALQAVQGMTSIGQRAVTQPILNYAETTGMNDTDAKNFVNTIEQSYLAGKQKISSNEEVSQ
ncbi:hypothetical protein AB0L47_08425 [Streptomyces bobili]